MEYLTLGTTGLTVSKMCIGTDDFGGKIEGAEALRIMNLAFENGINFFDTADSYSKGMSEEVIGRFCANKRPDIIIASKVFVPTSDKTLRKGLHKKHIKHSIEGTLKRLNTDYVDIYYLHYYDYETPLEETFEAFDLIVKQGKALYIGCSNFSGSQITEVSEIAKKNNLTSVKVVQNQYNLLSRKYENNLFKACESNSVGIIAYSPLAGGMLTGKYNNKNVPENSRLNPDHPSANFYLNSYWNENCFALLDALKKLSDEYGRTLTALSYAWLKNKQLVCSVIAGSKNVEQLKRNLNEFNTKLPNSLIEKAEKLSQKYSSQFQQQEKVVWQVANRNWQVK